MYVYIHGINLLLSNYLHEAATFPIVGTMRYLLVNASEFQRSVFKEALKLSEPVYVFKAENSLKDLPKFINLETSSLVGI